MSAANSDLYIGSRTLYGLAVEGKAPKIFKMVTKGGVPLPALVLCTMFCGLVFLKESPRWLMNKGRVEEARTSLAAFRGTDGDSPEVSAEITGIELALEETSRVAVKMSDIFTMGQDKLLYRFLLCIFLQFLQQMCGSNLISTYSTVSLFPIVSLQNPSLPSHLDHFPTGSRHEQRNLASALWRCADVEIRLLLRRLLHHRPFRASQALHVFRCGNGIMHVGSRSSIQLSHKQSTGTNCFRPLRILVQLLHPDWIPRRKLPLLYRGRAAAPTHGHVIHLDRQPLALVSSVIRKSK